MRTTRYLESSGLERSLSTNVPDHPTAIQVNGLRQERTEHVMCPGHVYGVNSYDTRTLCGNWAEERCDKAYKPSTTKAPSGSDWQFRTTYNTLRDEIGKVMVGQHAVVDGVEKGRRTALPDVPQPSARRLVRALPLRVLFRP